METIESEFVPVAIYNNVEGYDRTILEKFNEPTWNYQVMRFLNEEEEDILPRRDKVWSTHQVSTRLISALKAAGEEVPDHLKLVAAETAGQDNAARQESATFAMF